ncbi:polynucleotide adenylyltransferase PcnB [Idiomarina xiamenensis]|uniref:Poly(A) polymerase I n=1 Tax=Idiomarina xiamenensis 10-D-4 TaxID=740709 RepID=K2KLI4_9GAMM|nr:polynucleotide adenylyltransferase PcnB [Idiomarina xiamenensis]EKE87452.1 poly(A) polymerase [Idiomarina xiamenensis 10-D-4]
MGKPSSDNDSVGASILAEPIVIPRAQHSISRNQISENALKVLYRLHKSGFDAYLVGGCVRDLLLGITPKDFDVVTNAHPEQIKRLFRNCRLVGRRFRLAHIVFGRDIIEVATFRGHHNGEQAQTDKIAKQNDEGLLLRDNVYGDIDEDAERRDFTVNALYYNIADFAIYDYANGVRDIENGVLQLIGDAETRYREDPVRMLRAIRFATKLNMRLADNVAAPIKQLSPLLQNIPAARLFEEVLKLFVAGKAQANFLMLRDYQLFQQLFPLLKSHLQNEQAAPFQFLRQAFIDTDTRIANGQRVTPAYLFAALLWYPLQARMEQLITESDLTPIDAMNIAAADVMAKQVQQVSIPKRFSIPAREIWQLQQRLERSRGARADRLLTHPRFRAAYDFLLLRQRTAADNSDEQLALEKQAHYWTKRQQQAPQTDTQDGHKPKTKRRPRRSGRQTRPKRSSAERKSSS